MLWLHFFYFFICLIFILLIDNFLNTILITLRVYLYIMCMHMCVFYTEIKFKTHYDKFYYLENQDWGCVHSFHQSPWSRKRTVRMMLLFLLFSLELTYNSSLLYWLVNLINFIGLSVADLYILQRRAGICMHSNYFFSFSTYP